MSLADLVYIKKTRESAAAGFARRADSTVADVAAVAVASPPKVLFGPSLQSARSDRVGALLDHSSPRRQNLGSEDVKRQRTELIACIHDLSAIEGWWSKSRLDELLAAARWQAPLTLAPDIAYFTGLLSKARAQEARRAELDRRTWRGEGLKDRTV
ncbi:hypothetical protein [Caballeronia glebae]|uniref:hypothetical protein n=1 Tax=Caballeronia glebae TaxID=1777143 RepID=UPI0038BBA663